MTRAQIPRLADLASPAVTALLARRPTAARHIAEGRYGDVISGWLAQAALCRARLAKEVSASRLHMAEGADLAELAASEYWADLPPDPQYAVGNAILQREVRNSSETPAVAFAPGVIPKGFKLRRPADNDADPAKEYAEYETIEPVYFDTAEDAAIQDGSDWLHRQYGGVRIRAARPGPHANTPYWYDDPAMPGECVSAPFDSTITVSSLRAAGGSLGLVDDQIAAFAEAAYTGLLGPTGGAVVAGALSNPGTRRAIYTEDYNDAQGVLYLADGSWASSDYWCESVHQTLLGKGPEGGTPWLGFGASVGTRGVVNHRVVVEASVQLRSPDYDQDQTAILDAITKRLRWYFDERPDWWTWTVLGIRAALSVCDRRILTCSSVTVLDAAGAALSEPLATLDPDSLTSLHHYHLSSGGVRVTFTTPS